MLKNHHCTTDLKIEEEYPNTCVYKTDYIRQQTMNSAEWTIFCHTGNMDQTIFILEVLA